MCDQISLAVFLFLSLSASNPPLLQVGPADLAVTCGVVGCLFPLRLIHLHSFTFASVRFGLLKTVRGISGKALWPHPERKAEIN